MRFPLCVFPVSFSGWLFNLKLTNVPKEGGVSRIQGRVSASVLGNCHPSSSLLQFIQSLLDVLRSIPGLRNTVNHIIDHQTFVVLHFITCLIDAQTDAAISSRRGKIRNDWKRADKFQKGALARRIDA